MTRLASYRSPAHQECQEERAAAHDDDREHSMLRKSGQFLTNLQHGEPPLASVWDNEEK